MGSWFHARQFLCRFALIAAGPPALTACGGPLSTLEPVGPSAQGAATLWWIMFAGGSVLFLAVFLMLAVALIRAHLLRVFGPRRTILWGGLIIPMVILTALVGSAFALGERFLAKPRTQMPLRIEALARQWVWEFRYPDGAVSENVLYLPSGEDVDLAVQSEDVIHSFWIPRLGGKIDAIPGHVNVIRLRADRPGTYRGVCAEFCGNGHATMHFLVEAEGSE